MCTLHIIDSAAVVTHLCRHLVPPQPISTTSCIMIMHLANVVNFHLLIVLTWVTTSDHEVFRSPARADCHSIRTGYL